MTYKSLVLENFPVGYWENIKIGDNQFLNYPLAWSATANTILDEPYVGTYVDEYGGGIIFAKSSDSSPIKFELNNNKKISVNQGKYYTMVAYIKSGQGNRKCAINVKYTTTQNSNTLVDSEIIGDYFTLSDSEYTAVYFTDQAPTGLSLDAWAAWGIVSESGNTDDSIYIQNVDFFEGYPFLLDNEKSTNDGKIINYANITSKPIIFGTGNCVVIDENSFIQIENIYNMFIYGTENKEFSLDFWFATSNNPRNRHYLLSISGVLECYIEDDQIFIDSLGNRSGLKISDLNKQHYVYIEYSNRKFNINIDNEQNTSIYLSEDYYFPELINNEYPQIILGPASGSKNMILNSSFNLDTDFWEGLNSSIQVISTDSYSGSSSMEITKTAVNNSGLKQSNLIFIEPYTKYYASAYVKIPTGNENSNITITCNLYDSIDSPVLIDSISNTINLTSAGGWQRVSTPFVADIHSSYVEIIIKQNTAGTNGQKFLVDSVLLEKSYSPSDWSELFARSEYIYFTGLGIYKHILNSSNREKRINYAFKNNIDVLDVKFSADKFDLKYKKKYEVNNYSPLDIKDFNNSSINNFNNESKTLQMNKVSDPEIYVGPSGGYTQIDQYGAKFNLDSYIVIDPIDSQFTPTDSSIRLQTDFDTTSGDGTLLTIYPLLASYALVLEKNTNKIILKSISDYAGSTATQLFTTTTLSDGETNIAINFSNGYINAYINGQEFIDIEIPAISNNAQIIVGNFPGMSLPYPDYIRNLTIDNIVDFTTINWIDTGRYTLRLNGNINVSQKSTYSYNSNIPDNANNAIFTITDSNNSNILINNELVKTSGHIPNYNFTTPEKITLDVISETDDAFEKTRIIKNIFLITYDSTSIESNYANFSIYPHYISSAYLNSPYIPQVNDFNILSKSSNIGIKLDKNISTGAVLKSNSTSYRYLELIFKINSLPNAGEEFFIFKNTETSTNSLSLTDDYLLNKVGSYILYIDGIEVMNTSDIKIDINNIYHIFIDFGIEISDDIYLGSNMNSTNILDGSIGKIVLYKDNLSSLSTFITKRYNNIFSPTIYSKNGGTMTINDSTITQTYVRDQYNEYFEMVGLPKVKIYVK